MMPRLEITSRTVVVVTGASSGIGRATAHRFAEHGARVVLAARNADALREAAEECRKRGGTALAAPTDVSDRDAVAALAEQALAFGGGRIDVWVNNAAVLHIGSFESTPPEIFERVIDTNLLGYVHGARAALAAFRRRRRGVLINVASMVTQAGQPLSSAYVTSKWAIRGFTVALRQDLQDEPGIQVCMVHPAAIDTPLFQHAANYAGRPVKAPRPTYDPYVVADVIMDVARRPRREAFAGAVATMSHIQQRLAPDMTERLAARFMKSELFDNGTASPSPGNLFASRGPMGVDGGWIQRQGSGQSALAVPAMAAGLAVVPALIYLAARSRRARR